MDSGIPLRNPAADYSHDNFNAFTRDLRDRIEANQQVLVKMRSGLIIQLSWNSDDSDGEEVGFYCYENYFTGHWYNDGTSCTSRDFDIVERVIKQ